MPSLPRSSRRQLLSRWLEALRSSPRSSASTPFVRRLLRRTRIGFAAGSQRRGPISLRAKECGHGQSRSSSSAAAPPGATRAEALALLADLSPFDSAVALLEEALGEAEGHPALQASLHRLLAGYGRFTRGRRWAEVHSRAAIALAEQLGDEPLLAVATAGLAIIRFDLGDADAPRLADRAHELAIACGDKEAELKAAMALAHVLVWSVSTDRGRSLLEAQYRLLAGPERAHEHRRALVPGHDRAVGRALAAGGRIR